MTSKSFIKEPLCTFQSKDNNFFFSPFSKSGSKEENSRERRRRKHASLPHRDEAITSNGNTSSFYFSMPKLQLNKSKITYSFSPNNSTTTSSNSFDPGHIKNEIKFLHKQTEQINNEIEKLNEKIKINGKKLLDIRNYMGLISDQKKSYEEEIENLVSQKESFEELFKFLIEEYNKGTYIYKMIKDETIILIEDIFSNSAEDLLNELFYLFKLIHLDCEEIKDFIYNKIIKKNLEILQNEINTSLSSYEISNNFINNVSIEMCNAIQKEIGLSNFSALLKLLIKIKSLSKKIDHSLEKINEKTHEEQTESDDIIEHINFSNKKHMERKASLKQKIEQINKKIDHLQKIIIQRGDTSFSTAAEEALNRQSLNSLLRKSTKSITPEKRSPFSLLNRKCPTLRIINAKSFCYFRKITPFDVKFNPLDNMTLSPEELGYNPGMLSIDFLANRVEFSSSSVNHPTTIQISIHGIKSVEVEKNVLNIIKIYKAYRKKVEIKTEYSLNCTTINNIIQNKETMNIPFSQTDKIKSSFCHLFPFTIYLKDSIVYEIIFVTFEEFQSWYNGISLLIKKDSDSLEKKEKKEPKRNVYNKKREIVYHFVE